MYQSVSVSELKRQSCRYRRSENFRVLKSLYTWLIESCCFLNKIFLKALLWSFRIFLDWLYLIGFLVDTHTISGNRKRDWYVIFRNFEGCSGGFLFMLWMALLHVMCNFFSSTSVSASLPRTILKLHNFRVIPRMVKQIITDLDSSNPSGSECIPVLVLKICEAELSNILISSFFLYEFEGILFSRMLESLQRDLWLKTSSL